MASRIWPCRRWWDLLRLRAVARFALLAQTLEQSRFVAAITIMGGQRTTYLGTMMPSMLSACDSIGRRPQAWKAFPEVLEASDERAYMGWVDPPRLTVTDHNPQPTAASHAG